MTVDEAGQRRGHSRSPFSAMEDGFDEAITDPLWGHVRLTPELAAQVASGPFQKLTRIRQLGPAALVYPGATHTRAAHSLGVYHLARRLLRTLLERGADAWVDATGVRSFLAASLLHDLGHFPYAHSLKELPLQEHEALTARYVEQEPLASLIAQAGADPSLVASIVDTSRAPADSVQAPFFRSLLSGALDPDKLDYLRRDAWACGVPYGAQDVDFALSRLTPQRERGADIDARGVPSVEALLFSKYLMYRAVYWHRQVRVATAMVKKAVVRGLSAGVIAPEELYGLDDEGLFRVMADKDLPLFSLATQVREAKLFSIILEQPYDESRPFHTLAAELSQREGLEENLADRLSELTGKTIRPEDLLVDLPEPISFETGLYVKDEARPFAHSSTVFSPDVVASFVRARRVLRLCVRADLATPDVERAAERAIQELASGATPGATS